MKSKGRYTKVSLTPGHWSVSRQCQSSGTSRREARSTKLIFPGRMACQAGSMWGKVGGNRENDA